MSVFLTGNTGASTGPHLDFRVYNPGTGSYEDPAAYTKYLTVGDKGDPFNFQVTSPRGMRVHPTKGGMRMHEGIDYATPTGTALNVNGKLLSTWNDQGGGGIMSQYAIQTDDGVRELLLLHGSDANKITGTGALTEYDLEGFNPPTSGSGSPSDFLVEGGGPTQTPTETPAPRSKAKEKAKAYKDMSKSEMNAAYDKLRGSAKAKAEGMKMHKAFFGKR